MVSHNNFTIEKKGYSIEEVETAIEDLEAKNTFLTQENAELVQKLETSRRLIRRFTGMENDLRKDIADSKIAAASMIEDAQKRSEVLLDNAREECGKIISDLDMKIAERMDIVDNMKAEVAQFKEQLFDLYSSHIDMIEKMTAIAENFAYVPDYSSVSDAVDNFESAEGSDVEIPEFDEYPQESIFAEVEETNSESFVMNTAAPSVIFDEIEEETEIEQEEKSDFDFEPEEVEEELLKAEGFTLSEPFDEVDLSDEPEHKEFGLLEEDLLEENNIEEEIDNDEVIDEEISGSYYMTESEYKEEKAQEENMGDEEYFNFLKNFVNEDEPEGE